MAVTISPTGYALLGLLRLRPWTTYELAKQTQRSLHWFWPRAERRLYDEPKRLVEAGLATASAGQTGRRPRMVYAITPAGERALAAWLSETPAPRTTEDEAMLKVFFADAGSLEQLRATLDRVEADAAARVEELCAMAATPATDAPFPERLHISALALALQVQEELTQLRWARWARLQVAEWTVTDDSGTWDADVFLAWMAGEAMAEVRDGPAS